MAGSLPSFSLIRRRYNYLIGNSDYTTTNAINDSNINAAVQDFLNLYPYTWNVATTTGSLTTGTFSVAADFNPHWHLLDARVVNSGAGDDYIFTEVPIQDRDAYQSGDYVYWLTYDTSTKRYIFNTHTQSGTVRYYYYFFPDLMAASSDAAAQAVTCIIPDGEAVAYLAAAKNWIGDERNQSLAANYMAEGLKRAALLYSHDMQFGPNFSEGTVVDDNPGLTGGISSTLRIGT